MRIVPLISALAVTGLGTGVFSASWQATTSPADDVAPLLVGIACVRALPADDARLDAPVAGVLRVVNSFRAPTSAWTTGHRGVDLEAAVGIEVLAPASGTVSFSGRVVNLSLIHI